MKSGKHTKLIDANSRISLKNKLTNLIGVKLGLVHRTPWSNATTHIVTINPCIERVQYSTNAHGAVLGWGRGAQALPVFIQPPSSGADESQKEMRWKC